MPISRFARSALAAPAPIIEFDKIIPPGGTGNLQVDLETDLLNGPNQKGIIVYTNDPEQPEDRAGSASRLAALPQHRPGLHSLQRGAEVQQRQLDQAGRLGQQSERVPDHEGRVALHCYVTVSHREATDDERIASHSGPQHIVEVRLSPESPVGALTGYIDIYTDHEKQKKASVPLSGFVRPVFAVSPYELDYSQLPTLELPLTHRLTVKNFAQEEIPITSVSTDVEGVHTELEDVEPGRNYYLVVTLAEDMPKGPIPRHHSAWRPTAREAR